MALTVNILEISFLFKMAPHEHGENGWAAYEDIVPDFIDFLNEGPLAVGLKAKDNLT